MTATHRKLLEHSKVAGTVSVKAKLYARKVVYSFFFYHLTGNDLKSGIYLSFYLHIFFMHGGAMLYMCFCLELPW